MAMTRVEQLADFVVRTDFDQLSREARSRLKICVLDALGCAIGALAAEPIRWIREQVQEFGGAGLCTLISGGSTAAGPGFIEGRMGEAVEPGHSSSSAR